MLSRNPADYIRECKSDIHKIPRNIDPSLHPFEAAREYTRALNAAKLERVFAKPFVGSLDGHTDGVNCMAKFQKSLSLLLSGSCNGEVGPSVTGQWTTLTHCHFRFSSRQKNQIIQVLASHFSFLANRNAELTVPLLFWPISCMKMGDMLHC